MTQRALGATASAHFVFHFESEVGRVDIGDVRDTLVSWLSRFPRLGPAATVANRITERGDSMVARFFTGSHLYEIVAQTHNIVCTGFPLAADGVQQKTGIPIFSGPLDEEELSKLTTAILDREVVPFAELASAQRDAVPMTGTT